MNPICFLESPLIGIKSLINSGDIVNESFFSGENTAETTGPVVIVYCLMFFELIGNIVR